MTVQTNTNSIAYVGNGSTVRFDYDYLILDASHLKVYFGDVLQTSGYVVSGVLSQTGGTVTFAVAPPKGTEITLTRSVPFLQLTDYQPYDAFPAESHERALDLLTMMAQQLKDSADRSMQYPVGGNKWDAKGNEIINVAEGANDSSAPNVGQVKQLIAFLAGPDSAVQLRQDLLDSSGSSIVGFSQSGLGATSRTTQSKMRDVFSVKDFGAVGDGVADDSAFFLSAHTAAPIGAFIVIPSGTYLISNAVITTGRYFLLDGGTVVNQSNLVGANVVALSSFAKSGANDDITDVSKLKSINGGQIAGRRNRVINGAFDVWQLGTSIAITGHLQKCADRWNYDYNGGIGTMNVSRHNITPAELTSFEAFAPKYAARLTMSVAPTGNTFQDFSTQIESVRTLQGRRATISFYARSISGGNRIIVKTEQYFGGGGSPSSPAFNTSSPITISGTWQRYSVTFDIGSIAGKTLGLNGDDTLNVILSLPINQVFDMLIAGVQIESGEVPTLFEETPYSDTFAMCQRYLQTSYPDGTPPGAITAAGALAFQASGPNPLITVQLNMPMRELPFITYYNPATGAAGTWNDGGTARAVSTNTNGTKNVSVAVSGAVAGNYITGHYVIQDPFY